MGKKLTKKEQAEIRAYAKELGRTANAPTTAKDVAMRAESVGIGVESLIQRIQTPSIKKMTEEFVPVSGLVSAAKKGTSYEREAIHLNTMNQYALASGHARIAGTVRGLKGAEKVPGKLTRSAAGEYIARATLMEGTLRLAGIPLISAKAQKTAGLIHAIHLTSTDTLRIILGEAGPEALTSTVLNSKKGSENLQFQNIAEATRRIIEEVGKGGELDLDVVRNLVREALTTTQGVPLGSASRAAVEEAMKWANTSPAGKKAVETLTEALTRPAVIQKLVTENNKMMLVAAAMSRTDGIRLTQQLVDQINNLQYTGERLDAYGQILFDGGLKQVFDKDLLVNLTGERLNLAFADQNFAYLMSQVDPGALAILRSRFENIKAAKADAAKTGKGKKASTRKRTNVTVNEIKDAQKAIKDTAVDSVKNDPEAQALGHTFEEAVLNRQAYLEATYGTIVGGLLKFMGGFSNKISMGGELTTRLVGAEHERLLSAVEYSAGLAKLGADSGMSVPQINSIFEKMQRGEQLAGKEAKMQNSLNIYLDTLFGLGDTNKIAADGIIPQELGKALDKIGLSKYAAEFKNTTDPLAFKDFWKQLNIEEGENVLEVLSKFFTARQMATVPKYLASSLITHFGHREAGYTMEQAKKMGWKEIHPDSTLGSYLWSDNPKEKIFFPNEVVERMQVLEHYLDYNRGFKGDAGKVVAKLDAIVSVLKSTNTIWRPGHHAVSTLGNMLMNTVAGVWGVRDYGTAIRLLKLKDPTMVVDEAALAGIMRRNIPEGYQFKPDENGVGILLHDGPNIKTFNISDADLMKAIDGMTGVRITPHAAADVIVDEAGQFGKKGNIITRPIAKADHKIAEFAATRDNVFRYALFVNKLRKGGPYKDLDEAFTKAAQAVHEFHPTVGTLSGFERKYARRMFYFYTWQKQALVKMLEMAANQPAAITIPSKLQFAIAEMGGLNPNSFGDPHDPQSMYAAYNSNSLYGPQWRDDTWGLMGIKPASPQLDVFDSILGKFQTRPQDSMYENIANLMITGPANLLASNATPLFTIPAEIATGQRMGGLGSLNLTPAEMPKYLLEKTSFGSFARAAGWFNDGTETQFDLANQQRQMFNQIWGLKETFYEAPASLQQGRNELIDYWQKTYKVGKYYEGK